MGPRKEDQPELTPSPPWHSQARPGTLSPREAAEVSGGYGYLAPGRGEAQGGIEDCCPRKGEMGGQVFWTPLSPSLFSLPFPEGYTRRSQCRAGLWGDAPSQQKGRMDTQHREGGRERAQEGACPVQRPSGRSSVQAVRCWKSAWPPPVQSRRLEARSLAVWSAGPRVHPLPRPVLGVSAWEMEASRQPPCLPGPSEGPVLGLLVPEAGG